MLPWSRDEPLRVALACDVPQLKRIATAKRDRCATVQHLAAGVEVLIDDDHGRPQVPCANGGGQPSAPCADHNDIRLVVPLNSVAGGHLRERCSRRRQNRSTYTGGSTDAGGSSRLDEIASGNGLLALKVSILLITVAFLGHVYLR